MNIEHFALNVSDPVAAAAGVDDIAESSTLLFWLRCRKFGNLAELHEEARSAARTNLGAQRLAGRLGSSRIQRARSAHYVSPAQVSQHTI